ncbi:MAG: YCF48-related protein [Patescibacteria group bacterium]
MNKKILYLFAIFMMLITLGASCSGCSSKPKDGGVYKSTDQGETWEQKTFISKVKRKVYTISELNITCFEFDKNDSNVVYAGTMGAGIVVTKNGGENWEATGLTTGNIYSIDIDPIDRNILYAAKDYYIIRTVDGGANWETVHTDTKKNKFNQVIIDTYDPHKIYAVSDSGIVYKSVDQGVNWEIKLQLDSEIKNLYMRDRDTRILYALTQDGDIYKTTTGGELIVSDENVDNQDESELIVNNAWTNIITKEHKDKWPTGKTAKNMFIFPQEPNSIYMVTRHGLLKSTNEGASWVEMKTLIPLDDKENDKIINLNMDALDSRIMYFTISGTDKIHKSTNSGGNWKVIENFPSTKLIKTLVINPYEPSTLYTGIEIPEEKGGLIKT